MRYAVVWLGLSGLISACSNQADYPENTLNIDETLSTENIVGADEVVPAEVAEPDHNYDFREGDTYGYIAAVSEEDRKRGRAAGDVVLFIYRGKTEDGHRLEQVDASGRSLGYAECAVPCVAIRTTRFGRVDRLAFNPSSVIGAAFEDALNGKLVEPTPTPPENDPPRPASQTEVGVGGAVPTEAANNESYAPAEQ